MDFSSAAQLLLEGANDALGQPGFLNETVEFFDPAFDKAKDSLGGAAVVAVSQGIKKVNEVMADETDQNITTQVNLPPPTPQLLNSSTPLGELPK